MRGNDMAWGKGKHHGGLNKEGRTLVKLTKLCPRVAGW